MSKTTPSEGALTAAETTDLRVVAGHIIPASAAHGAPGADDETIFADIVASLGRDLPAVRRALSTIADMADGPLARLPRETQAETLATFREKHPGAAGVLYSVTVQCYYRDDRVMASIGMDVRAPFPKGFEIIEGDFSLLEPVRARGRIYRDAG